jgi:hypothetical protein
VSFNNDDDSDGLAALFGGVTPQADPGPRRTAAAPPESEGPATTAPQTPPPPVAAPPVAAPPVAAPQYPGLAPSYEPPTFAAPASPAYEMPAPIPQASPSYDLPAPASAPSTPQTYDLPAPAQYPAQVPSAPSYPPTAQYPAGLDPATAFPTAPPTGQAYPPTASPQPPVYEPPPAYQPPAAYEPPAAYQPPAAYEPLGYRPPPAAEQPATVAPPSPYEPPVAYPPPAYPPAAMPAPEYSPPAYPPPVVPPAPQDSQVPGVAAQAADPVGYPPALAEPPLIAEPVASAYQEHPLVRSEPAVPATVFPPGPLLPSTRAAVETPEDLERSTAGEKVGLVLAALTGPLGLAFAIVNAARSGRRRGWLIGVVRASLILGVISTIAAGIAAYAFWTIRADQLQHAEIAAASAEFCAAAEADPTMVAPPMLGWPAPGASVSESLTLMQAWTDRWTTLAASSPADLRTGMELLAERGQTIIDAVTAARTVDDAANQAQIAAAEAQSGVANWYTTYCLEP